MKKFFRWLWYGRPVIYLAQAMSMCDRHQQRQIAKQAVKAFRKAGFYPWSPVLQEKVPDKRGPLKPDPQVLDWKWPMDKDVLHWQAWGVCFLTGDLKSFGCEDEYAIMRGSEWQPSVWVSPKHAAGYVSTRKQMADSITGTVEDAAEYFKKHFATRYQRIGWKLILLAHHLLPWGVRQINRLRL